jgi:hypothetical protein
VFLAALQGLEAAVAGLTDATELTVTSVLVPKRRAQLEAMPALLRRIGVRRWVVTALVKLPDDCLGGPVGGRDGILEDLGVLAGLAADAGIEFAVDDEFDSLGGVCGPNQDQSRIRRLIQPEGVFRLVPDGRCSKGSSILWPLTDDTPRWDPQAMDAGAFLLHMDSGQR